jgi:hypothetical protein
MNTSRACSVLAPIVLIVLALVGPVMAQQEVAPDRFDGTDYRVPRKVYRSQSSRVRKSRNDRSRIAAGRRRRQVRGATRAIAHLRQGR